jgi:hypothetical protein
VADIEWWGWILIWTGLVLALLVMLGLFAWWLFRKFLVLMDDVATLADKTAVIDPDDAELIKPQLAVLADMRDIRNRENARRGHRAERRRLRWQARLDRARRITRADPTQTEWPADWYGKRP